MEDKKIMVTIALDELIELKSGYDVKGYYAKEVEDWKKLWSEKEQKLRELEQELIQEEELLVANGYVKTENGWKKEEG